MALVHQDEQTVTEFLNILEQHRIECEQNGLYVEAEVALKRLQELRKHEESRRREAIKSRHIAEKLDVEETYLIEIEELNNRWNQRIAEYEEQVAQSEADLIAKHEQDRKDWQYSMQDKFLLRPKYSKELLNLRKIEVTLAKAREYQDAAKVKMQADVMQKWELEDLKRDWQQKLATREQHLQKKQDTELEAFRIKVVAGRQKLKRDRMEELNKMLKRYNNLKLDLDKKQHLERVRLAKFVRPR